jgi:tetratricopeptide (TPR) repeat protein
MTGISYRVLLGGRAVFSSFRLMPLGVLALFHICGCVPESTAVFTEFAGQNYAAGEKGENSLSPETLAGYNYLLLQEAISKGDTETALSVALELLALAPLPEIYAEAASLLEQSGQPDEALRKAEEGAKLYPDEFTLAMLWAKMLENSQNTDAAISVLKDYALRHSAWPTPERMEELLLARQTTIALLMEKMRLKEAAAFIDAIPPAERSPSILYYEVLILRHDDNKRLASLKLRELLEKHPDFPDAWLVLAEDMEKSGHYRQAANFYQKALEQSPFGDIYLYKLRALLRAGEYKAALKETLEARIDAELKLRSSLIFIDFKYLTEAKQILEILESDPYLADDVSLYLGIIAYDSGQDMPKALARLQDISPDAPNRAHMLYVKFLLCMHLNDKAGALETARILRDDYPDNKENWLILVELTTTYAREYVEAESICREALEQWPEDMRLQYALAISLSFQKRNNESIAVLEEILLQDGGNIIAMNALGYTLAEEKRELKRALSLVGKALAQEPDNIAYLDSMAWVQYQLGNFREAWGMIKKCVEKGSDDAVIWDHYGDIALAVNDKPSATRGYQRALSLQPENSVGIRDKLERLK